MSVAYAFRPGTVDGATGGTITGDVAIQSDLDVDGDIRATGKATIGPGNTNTGNNAFVAGEGNTVNGTNASVAGGTGNTAYGTSSFVGGGSSNLADDLFSVVGGGIGNTSFMVATTIAGGSNNLIDGTGDYGAIGGGGADLASRSRRVTAAAERGCEP